MKSLIQKLVEIPSPPGYEHQICAAIRAEVEPLADEVRVDALGNLIASLGAARDGNYKVMLSAHMDEIGLMVTHIDDLGFVRFLPIGGVNPQSCPGGRVRFLNGACGVIGLERLNDSSRVPAFEQMFIDLGSSSRADCPVKVGEVAVFERPFLDLGKRLISKAMDDRIGVAVLIETMRLVKEKIISPTQQIIFVFSVQEEVGLRGASTAAYGLDPDLALAVDVTRSGDTPKGIKMEVSLGRGPAIKVRDGGMLSDPRLVQWMVDKAEEAGLPYQMEVLEHGTTDARAIQVSRAGVPAGCLSIPCRYIHSPSEMVDYEDVQNAVRLLAELLQAPLRSE